MHDLLMGLPADRRRGRAGVAVAVAVALGGGLRAVALGAQLEDDVALVVEDGVGQAVCVQAGVPVVPHALEHLQLGEDAREVKDRKSTRLNSSHSGESRMPSSA